MRSRTFSSCCTIKAVVRARTGRLTWTETAKLIRVVERTPIIRAHISARQLGAPNTLATRAASRFSAYWRCRNRKCAIISRSRHKRLFEHTMKPGTCNPSQLSHLFQAGSKGWCAVRTLQVTTLNTLCRENCAQKGGSTSEITTWRERSIDQLSG